MKFLEALKEMKEGKKVKLPSWGGYWVYDAELDSIYMHTKDNKVLEIRETNRLSYTLENILSEEWVVADEVNTPILGGVATFSFGEALKYLKRGLKVARQGWNGKDQYLIYVEPYNSKYFDVIEKDIPGTLYPYIAMKTNYNGIVPWLASQTDMLNEDWVFVD